MHGCRCSQHNTPLCDQHTLCIIANCLLCFEVNSVSYIPPRIPDQQRALIGCRGSGRPGQIVSGAEEVCPLDLLASVRILCWCCDDASLSRSVFSQSSWDLVLCYWQCIYSLYSMHNNVFIVFFCAINSIDIKNSVDLFCIWINPITFVHLIK